MNDEDIAKLKEACKAGPVVWAPDGYTWRKVERIGTSPAEWDEPSECAYFDRGHYAVLYNCELNDFARIERLT